MAVEEVTTFTPEVLTAINDLIGQLSTSAPQLTEDEVHELVEQPNIYLFVFRSDDQADAGRILGMLTLATFMIPTGWRGWVEDVVVDQDARGHGAGKALVDAALRKAGEVGATTVDLTSRPHREAANRLYVRCGFEPRETNIYRYKV